MKASTVIAHYGSGVAAAKALHLTKAAVSYWLTQCHDRVPLGRAYEIQVLTGGALRVDKSLYPVRAPPPPKPRVCRGCRRPLDPQAA